MPAAEPGLVEWGMATRTLPGETESGDLALVKPFPRGVLGAVIDGLGHGPEAARAARAARKTLGDGAGQTVERLLQRSHVRLARTRGAVMSVACFDSGGTMTWLGVGNVEGRLLRLEDGVTWEALPLFAGIVGYRMPPLQSISLPLRRGDVVILATDGIRSDFAAPKNPSASAEAIARRILDEDGIDTDDALVLVARYLGAPR